MFYLSVIFFKSIEQHENPFVNFYLINFFTFLLWSTAPIWKCSNNLSQQWRRYFFPNLPISSKTQGKHAGWASPQQIVRCDPRTSESYLTVGTGKSKKEFWWRKFILRFWFYVFHANAYLLHQIKDCLESFKNAVKVYRRESNVNFRQTSKDTETLADIESSFVSNIQRVTDGTLHCIA